MDTEQPKVQKITIRDRKKNQPGAKLFFSEAEKQTIVNTVAKDLIDPERNIFFYQCQALGLNPLLNEICAVVYKSQDGIRKMSVQVMRDGFLTIAHRSGKFAGLESGVYEADANRAVMAGWCKVYHKDFNQPVYQEADLNEYASTRNSLWQSKPKTMIKKVAESMALRKAFNVSGVYASEEMDLEIAKEKLPDKVMAIDNGDQPATEAQIATIKALSPDEEHEPFDITSLNRQEASDWIRELSQKKGKNENT
jgi:phage recombination protein Bet